MWRPPTKGYTATVAGKFRGKFRESSRRLWCQFPLTASQVKRTILRMSGVITQITKTTQVAFAVFLWATLLAGQQQKAFPVTSVVDDPTVAGHPVQLDGEGK